MKADGQMEKLAFDSRIQVIVLESKWIVLV